VELLKIGELARRSGVPLATLKHYLREGLIRPAHKSGRTMSWYEPALVDRVRTIKELQQRQFLPLDVIRDTLDRNGEAADDLEAADAIARVLARHGGSRSRSREEVLARGGRERELAWLEAAGLAVPSAADRRYRGDDLALLSTLAAARRAGLGAGMLPFEILDRYLAALRALVAIELEMFRTGVFPRAKPGELARLTTAATRLSERLVVLLRRKLLLPTLDQLAHEKPHASPPRRRTKAHATPPDHGAGRLRGVRRKRRRQPGSRRDAGRA
jgi:DNA-binding transcriptional MerR regulator